jgi:hypothetical protein
MVKANKDKIISYFFSLTKIFGTIIFFRAIIESENIIFFFGGLIYFGIIIYELIKLEKISTELEELQLNIYRISKTKNIKKNFLEDEIINSAIQKGRTIEFNIFNNLTGGNWEEFKKVERK